MPLAALLRHLGKMTADKVFSPGSAEVAAVCERIQDETALKKVPVSNNLENYFLCVCIVQVVLHVFIFDKWSCNGVL